MAVNHRVPTLSHFVLHLSPDLFTFINPLIPLKAINYFDDIDPEIDPPKLKKKLPLAEIKKRINDSVLHSKKKF